ncbi:uncharacterized protein LOC126379771 [Pectinophora gossypiella]|uniref:uncharacterized protein LOC126379771 n=1 Tax=Pectinophora gossypiella TaxID=13191 RepID=UPI00214E3C33|nr:uncharacterized protein LOC126379771 [Pectinophora gossypiella]
MSGTLGGEAGRPCQARAAAAASSTPAANSAPARGAAVARCTCLSLAILRHSFPRTGRLRRIGSESTESSRSLSAAPKVTIALQACSLPLMALTMADSERSAPITVDTAARRTAQAEHSSRVCRAVSTMPPTQWWHSAGRPLCLFYFAHPFGVLSCEPPTVLLPGAASAAAPGAAAPGAMARRAAAPAAAWPAATVPARRLPPYTRTLPPLRLPTPRPTSSPGDCDDVWSRSIFVPPEKVSLPPIELPLATGEMCPAGYSAVAVSGGVDAVPAGGACAVGAARARRSPRPGPVGVRKRSRGALTRLLRRAVATELKREREG